MVAWDRTGEHDPPKEPSRGDRLYSRTVFPGTALICLNVVWHGLMIAAVVSTERWIEFTAAYRILACYAPPVTTLLCVLLFSGASVKGDKVNFAALGISFAMAVAHYTLIDAAIAAV